jgi:hypothetical protein
MCIYLLTHFSSFAIFSFLFNKYIYAMFLKYFKFENLARSSSRFLFTLICQRVYLSTSNDWVNNFRSRMSQSKIYWFLLSSCFFRFLRCYNYTFWHFTDVILRRDSPVLFSYQHLNILFLKHKILKEVHFLVVQIFLSIFCFLIVFF